MNILITGAAGFIGYSLVKKMQDSYYKVIGIDSINSYYDVDLKHSRLQDTGINISQIQDNKRLHSSINQYYSFQKTDITDLKELQKLFEKEHFDIVINLAAQAGVRYSLQNTHAYVQSNLVGFVNLLECCRHYKIKHFIYASSSSVYGMNDKVPFSEDDNVDYPVSLYAATKKSNELMAHTYSHLYFLPTTGLRFFTVYGPWGRPDMSPMLFANAILNDHPIKVFNYGNMERDFTYIDDIVKSVTDIIEKIPDKNEKHPYYRLLNIGNSCPVQLMDFITIMEKCLDKKAVKEMLPMQAGDVKRTYADTSKLEKITSYRPNTSLEYGLSEFLQWYKSYYCI